MASHRETGLSRRGLIRGGVAAAGGALLFGAASSASAAPVNRQLSTSYSASAATTWMSTTYELVRRENLTPPAAARVYSLVAIAMYESARVGAPGRKSLAGQLTDLQAFSRPAHRGHIDWPTAVAVAANAALESVLPFRGATSRQFLADALAVSMAQAQRDGATPEQVRAAVSHGLATGAHVVSWAAGDGFAGIVGRAFTPPTGHAYLWESTPPNFRPAVEPFWNEIRPMILRSADEVEPEPHIPFDADPSSAFGQQALTTYRQKALNTDAERAIASFWTDNPGSFTPPFGTSTGLPAGHWMLICSIAITDDALDLAAATEAYARVGIALHDAFLNCWTWKYRFNLLRPVTYINRYIDPTWSSFINSPQFPEYSSGHSVASPAAAAVLSDIFGNRPYVDNSGAYRGVPSRAFTSFTHAAEEAAASRLYGGIHYPMAIANGLVQGREIGELTLARVSTR